MKFTSVVNNVKNLQYGGKLLDKLFDAAPEKFNTTTVFSGCTSASLWNAKLFSAQESMSESFKYTVGMVSLLDLQKTSVEAIQSKLYSMDDLVTLKDCKGILEYRKLLTDLYKE